MTETLPQYVPQYVPPTYISTTDTAKLIRTQLKNAFPSVKFSVKSHKYAGGSSITVRWTDGPTTKQVDEVVKIFSGSSFDGMIDLKYGRQHWLCPDGTVTLAHWGGQGSTHEEGFGDAPDPNAKLVSISADHIFTERDISPEWKTEIFQVFGEVVGRDLGDPNVGWDAWNQVVPLAVDRWTGKLLHMVEHETDRVSSVFHQFTGHRQGGDCRTGEVVAS